MGESIKVNKGIGFINMGRIMKKIILGGLGLLILTLFVNYFFQAPVSKADYNGFKAETETNYKHIKEGIVDLKTGQQSIQKDIKELFKKK